MKKRFLCKLVAAAVSVLMAVSSMPASGVVTFGEECAVDDSWKAKLDNILLEKMEEGDGKIPVWLWMVLKEPTEEEFNKMVKEKIEAGNSNVSDETELETLAAENPGLSREKLENLLLSKKIDTYMSAYRSVQEEICDKSNQLVFSQLGIPEENIIKSKTAAPLYIVYIEKDDIQRVAENPLVRAIYYYDEPEFVPDVEEIPDDFDPTESSDDVRWIYNEETGVITMFDQKTVSEDVLRSLKGKSVKEFADRVTQVVVDESITAIKKDYFADFGKTEADGKKVLTNLVSYIIPETVTEISEEAFSFDDTTLEGRLALIYGKKGSAAEAYANAHEGLIFLEEELLGKDQYGDANRNGSYEASDALEILKMTVQLQETDNYGDANLDGKVTAEDALEVLKSVVKIK